MRMKTILLLLVCFLLSGLHLPTIACPHPDCGSCCYWVSTGPEPDDGYCELMPGADCGACAGCPPCCSCVSCYCLWDCTNPFATCCDGSCCNSGNCCNSTTCCPNSDDICCTDSGSYCCESGKTCCQGSCCASTQCCNDGTCVTTCPGCCECEDGSCEPKDSECGNCQECNANCECVKKAGAECEGDSDCEPEEHCVVFTPVCECYCDGGSCWEEDYVPPLEEECDECDDFLVGCTDIVEIRNSYTRWIVATTEGYCKDPRKQVTVGYIYECAEVYDEDLFAVCAAIIGAACYYPCQAGWKQCAACIVGVGAACAFPDGICTFVEDCVPGDVLMPVERDVVDNDGDWGNFQKCGIIS